MNIKQTLFLSALTLLVLTILAGGCSKDRTTSPDGSNSADVSVRLLKSSLAARVDLMRLQVFQNEALITSATTEVVDGAFSFDGVALPIGIYFFTVEGIDILPDDNQVVIYSGEDEVEIVAGSNPVTIDVSPAVPMVRVGPYNVTTAETATFTSKVEIWNIPELRSGTLLIPIDPTKVSFLNATASNNDWGPLEIVAEVIEGELQLSFTRVSELDIVPTRHEIIDLSFTAIDAGDMDLAPEIVTLADDEGNIPGLASVYEESQAVSILSGVGNLRGGVSEAITGLPLVGASVSAIGPVSRETVSDESGVYSFEDLPYGNYEVTASLSGYAASIRTVSHIAPVTISTFALSQELAAGRYRIVLTWGNQPPDLDAHIWTTIDEVIYEIYFNNEGDSTSLPFIMLDHDDVDSLGPETITIYEISNSCLFAVHNYSLDNWDPNDPEPNPMPATLTASNARVEIYSNNGRIDSYSVPTAGEGLWWYVFDISPQGVITEHNTLSDDPPVGAVKSPATKEKVH